MQSFDITLKGVLERQLRGGALAEWIGFTVVEWLKTDLPEVRARQVDLLGRTPDGTIVHIEIQSANDPNMGLRMAEYALAILRRYESLPRQTVLYVGYEPLRMPSGLSGRDISFGYRLMDIRDLDAEPLIESDRVEDNVIAILGRLKSERSAVRRILERIAGASPPERNRALNELTILAGLRRLRSIIETETHAMPVVLDIMDHDLFGPIMRKGIAQGMEKGLEQGLETARRITFSLLANRFGALDHATEARLAAMTANELESLSARILSAKSLAEVFGR